MCTATFIPLKNNSYLFTHNRDEKISRSIATLPRRYKMSDGSVVMPVDPISNGTWIATSSCVFSLCLLNGALEINQSKTNYPNSRGQIILDFFNFGDAKKMSEEYDWSRYEAFTLIVVQHVQNIVHLFEIIWDENTIRFSEKDANLAHIWSSSTLYSALEKTNRQSWFQYFLQNTLEVSEKNIIQFHHFSPKTNNEEGFIIDRKDTGRKTVSLSCIHNTNNELCTFYYKDFLQGKSKKTRIFK